MNSEALTWRSLAEVDADLVLAFMRACDQRDFGEPDTDMADLLYGWNQMDLSQDAWLVSDSDGDPVAYAGVIPAGDNFQYDFYLSREAEKRSVGNELLARCQQRAEKLLSVRNEAAAQATVYVAHVNERQRVLLQSAGFELVKYHFQMQIELDRPVATPSWPHGVTVRTFRPGTDDGAVHALVQTAFERPGRPPQPLDQWREFMMRPDLFDPAYWFLALAGDRLLGVCLAFIYPGMGWVRQLAVDPEQQGRGLGAALLIHAFRVFQQQGLPRVGLGVAGDNSSAQRFYLRLGMQVERHYDEYQKPVEI